MKRLTLRGQMIHEYVRDTKMNVGPASTLADAILSHPDNVEDVPETWAQVIGVPKPPTTDGTGRAP